MAESDMLSALLNDPHALEQALSAASEGAALANRLRSMLGQ